MFALLFNAVHAAEEHHRNVHNKRLFSYNKLEMSAVNEAMTVFKTTKAGDDPVTITGLCLH